MVFSRLVIIILGLLGAVGLGQGPEIVTQYEQRLGGALSELRTIIDQFDSDVAKNGLRRDQALAIYQKSPEQFLHDRGQSMQTAITRYESLRRQVVTFKTTNELYKPVYMIMQADQQVLEGVMDDYTVGLPATTGSVFYGVIGALVGAFLGWFFRLLSGLDKRPSKIRMTR